MDVASNVMMPSSTTSGITTGARDPHVLAYITLMSGSIAEAFIENHCLYVVLLYCQIIKC